MVRLAAITIEGYKSFARATTLELRPLTLLYGRNNAGKSALLRLLPLLADSVAEDATAPIALQGRAGRDAGYRDVVSRGQRHNRISLTLRWDTGHEDRFTVDLEVPDPVDERVIVRQLRSLAPGGKPEMDLNLAPDIDADTYRVTFASSGEESLSLTFDGLVPASDHDRPELVALRGRLASLRRQVLWLDSVRARPQRLTRKPNAPPRMLESDGAGAVEALLSRETILHEVATWYRDALERDLRVVEVERPLYRVMLDARQGPVRDIALSDTGEGMTQVLPVLVAAAMARDGGPRYLAIEDPASHLHPNAQRALAMHLAELAAGPTPPLTVIETHARVLLLGVQLAVAQGRLEPSHVAAYWVDTETDGTSVATQVGFDERGRLRGWPRSAFAEDRALTRELLPFQLPDEV